MFQGFTVLREQFRSSTSKQFLNVKFSKKTPLCHESIALRKKFYLKFNGVVF
jgi:hypothetical protein